MSSRFLKMIVMTMLALALAGVCACGDGSMTDEEIVAPEEGSRYIMDDVDLRPVDDADVEGCEPGWDGC